MVGWSRVRCMTSPEFHSYFLAHSNTNIGNQRQTFKPQKTKNVCFFSFFFSPLSHTKTRSLLHICCWHCANEGGTTSEFLVAAGSLLGEGWDLFLEVVGPSARGEVTEDNLGAKTVLPDSDPYPLLQLLRLRCIISDTVADCNEQSSQWAGTTTESFRSPESLPPKTSSW